MLKRRSVVSMIAAVIVASAACTGPSDDSARPQEPETREAEPVEVSAPPGFRIHRGEDYGFVFPSEWTPVAGGGTFVAGAEMEIVGPKGEAGLPPLITVYREEHFEGDFQRYLFTFNGEAAVALPDRTVIRNEPASVPQSVEAHVIESEYTLPGLAPVDPEEPEEEGEPQGGDESRDSGESDDSNYSESGDSEAGAPDDADEAGDDGSVTIRQVDILVLTRDDVTINLRAAAPAEEFDGFSEIFTTVMNSLRVQPPSAGDA